MADIIIGKTTLKGCTTRRHKVQNDGETWIINQSNNPVEPINKELFLKLGISINPNDIPTEKLSEPITIKKMSSSQVGK